MDLFKHLHHSCVSYALSRHSIRWHRTTRIKRFHCTTLIRVHLSLIRLHKLLSQSTC